MQATDRAPWSLRGEAVIAIRLTPLRIARTLVPAHARIVTVRPNRTLSVLYLSHYTTSPVGAYHECILAPALLRIGVHAGAWISHIAVDEERSMTAGRSIWALPKMMGSVARRADDWVSTSPLGSIELRLDRKLTSAPLPFAGAAMSEHEGRSSWFTVSGRARVCVCRGRLQLASAELEMLGLGACRRFYRFKNLHLRIGPPRPITLTG